jgi:chemotaxis signal transduction protein
VDPRRIVGGIAIVFHAERELRAILQDILGDRPGLAAFVDAQGRVLAHVGTVDPVPALTGFDGAQAIVTQGDTQLWCARVAGRGYREFRQTDGYDHGVQVVVGLLLGPVERRRRAYSDAALKPPALRVDSRSQELAIFQVGAGCYALPSAALVEARTPQGLVSPPQAQDARAGLLEVDEAAGGRLVHVLCARRLFGVSHAPRAGDGTVLVLRHPRQPEQALLGLRVDDVLSVVDADPRDLGQAPAGFRPFAPWVTHLLRCDTAWGEPLLVQVLSPDVLLAQAGLDLGRVAAAPGAISRWRVARRCPPGPERGRRVRRLTRRWRPR